MFIRYSYSGSFRMEFKEFKLRYDISIDVMDLLDTADNMLPPNSNVCKHSMAII